MGRCRGQYLFRRGTELPHTEQFPSTLRFGARTLFTLAAHEREQNFGFLVFRPQTGHAAMAILSEGWFRVVDAGIGASCDLSRRLCRDCTVTA